MISPPSSLLSSRFPAVVGVAAGAAAVGTTAEEEITSSILPTKTRSEADAVDADRVVAATATTTEERDHIEKAEENPHTDAATTTKKKEEEEEAARLVDEEEIVREAIEAGRGGTFQRSEQFVDLSVT